MSNEGALALQFAGKANVDSGPARAIARAADRVIDAMPPSDRALARRLLLALVTPGRGGPDETRTVDIDHALQAMGDSTRSECVLAVLSGQRPADGPPNLPPPSRLVVVKRSTGLSDDSAGSRVELTYLDLLRYWPRLRAWVDDARIVLERRDEVESAAAAWSLAQRSDDQLPCGPNLTRLQGDDLDDESRRTLHGTLSTVARACLERAAHRREALELARADAREAAVLRTRAADQAQADASVAAARNDAQRAHRRLRWMVGGAAMVVVLATSAMVVAMHRESRAEAQRELAEAQSTVLTSQLGEVAAVAQELEVLAGSANGGELYDIADRLRRAIDESRDGVSRVSLRPVPVNAMAHYAVSTGPVHP